VPISPELSVQALSSRAGISGIAIRISQLFFHTVCHLLYRLISALFFDPELRLLPRQRLCLLCTVLRPLRLPFFLRALIPNPIAKGTSGNKCKDRKKLQHAPGQFTGRAVKA